MDSWTSENSKISQYYKINGPFSRTFVFRALGFLLGVLKCIFMT